MRGAIPGNGHAGACNGQGVGKAPRSARGRRHGEKTQHSAPFEVGLEAWVAQEEATGT